MDAPRGPDVGSLLIRAIRTSAFAAGCPVAVESIGGRPWASATFQGTRHRIVLTARDVPGLRSWINTLPEAEFAIRGHVVADLAVEEVAWTQDTPDASAWITLAMLTLIDA